MKDDTNHMQAQDQDIIRGIKVNLASRLHFTPGSWTHSADLKKGLRGIEWVNFRA
jgi:hypothetical protein